MKTISQYLSPYFFENFSINEVGIKLQDQNLAKIRDKLQKLEARAPTYSTINLDFINIGSCIQGKLEISSTGKNFHSTIKGEDPWEIYQKLESKIDQQLIQWKKNRFSKEFAEPVVEAQHQRLTGGYVI